MLTGSGPRLGTGLDLNQQVFDVVVVAEQVDIVDDQHQRSPSFLRKPRGYNLQFIKSWETRSITWNIHARVSVTYLSQYQPRAQLTSQTSAPVLSPHKEQQRGDEHTFSRLPPLEQARITILPKLIIQRPPKAQSEDLEIGMRLADRDPIHFHRFHRIIQHANLPGTLDTRKLEVNHFKFPHFRKSAHLWPEEHKISSRLLTHDDPIDLLLLLPIRSRRPGLERIIVVVVSEFASTCPSHIADRERAFYLTKGPPGPFRTSL